MSVSNFSDSIGTDIKPYVCRLKQILIPSTVSLCITLWRQAINYLMKWKNYFLRYGIGCDSQLIELQNVIPVAVTSSAVVSENNYEYIGEVRGAVKAVGNAKDFNGAVNYSNTSRPISVNFGVLGGLNERNLLKWHFFCNFAAHNSA